SGKKYGASAIQKLVRFVTTWPPSRPTRKRLTRPPINQTQSACVSSCPKTYNRIGRGRPINAINHSTTPNEKNQNSCPAHNRCASVARANTVKNVWVRIAQTGSRKTAKIKLTQRVGTINGVIVADPLLVGTT